MVITMKVSLFKNDKSTYWDEVILLCVVAVFIVAGVVLMYFKPSFWIIEECNSVVFGVLMIIAGGGCIPGLIYRLFHND